MEQQNLFFFTFSFKHFKLLLNMRVTSDTAHINWPLLFPKLVISATNSFIFNEEEKKVCCAKITLASNAN